MSLPYIFSSSFDTGDNSEWDSESDTGTLLDFVHYTTLGGIPGAPAPYRGAYCMRIQPGDTNDHTLLEGDLNIADTATAWTRFPFYVSDTFAATADDVFNIFEWQQAGGTVEAVISLQITAATDEVGIGIKDGTEATAFVPLSKGKWHVIEAKFTVDVTPGTGTVLELYLDGQLVASDSGANQAAAIGLGVLGTQNTLATTNAGYLLFDEFAFDDTRMSITHRFAEHRIITASSFLFVGSGRIGNVKLIDTGGGDVVLKLYDVDEYSASSEPRWYGHTITADVDVDAADVPIEFTRGCLAVLSGTLPAAQFQISRATGWGSDGAIKTHASKRKAA
ncbi:MAG: hypothetical protein ABUK15_07380 [Anaerolineales bacterium]